MANECREDDNQLQVKPIHFKIILTHSLQEGKLMIPRTFVEKYGEGLPKTVFLKPPNGVEWEVNLVKHDGEIWFQKGWKEFAEHHSLAEGHIVVFKYERTSNFQVLIFDMSALEIDYPFKRVEGERTSNDQGNKPPMVGSLEDHRPSQKRKDHSSPEFLQQFNKKSRRVEVESISNLSEEVVRHTGKKCKVEPKTTSKQSSFKPSNPSFLVFMHPSYLHSKANLNIPAKFGKRYFDLGIKRGDINLQLANGRVWPARYLIRETNIGPKFELSSGWKPFAKDNNLKVGDVCTLELIDRTKLTFQVHIFRDSDNSNCSASQGFKLTVRSPEEENEMSGLPSSNFSKKPTTGAKQIAALQRASSFKPCDPSFVVVMHLSYVSSRERLNIPSKFGKLYFDLSIKQGDVKLHLANGRIWPARYLIRETSKGTKFELKNGWNSFAKDNNLKVGDACTFELIERTKLTFQVYIFRETDNSNFLTSQESADRPRNHDLSIKEEWE